MGLYFCSQEGAKSIHNALSLRLFAAEWVLHVGYYRLFTP